VAAGADIITFQVESTRHPHRVLQRLKELENRNDPNSDLMRGIGLNPGTPLGVVEPLLDELEMILLLAVNPGWSGQKFIASTTNRIAQTKEFIAASGREILICVDGGVTKQNIEEIINLGADLIVAGSAIFDGKTPRENAQFMLEACHRGTV
jgi:ribulose-phosphate 3-epimerase